MDMYLRETIMKNLESQEVDDVVLATAEQRKIFCRFCDTFILKEIKLLCKGRSDVEPKVIPIPQQVDDCLFGRHVAPLGRHVWDRQALVKAISNAGYEVCKVSCQVWGARSSSGRVSQKSRIVQKA